MTYHQALSKALQLARGTVKALGLDTVDWVHELQLIGCACLLAAIILISVQLISAVSERLACYPAVASVTNSFTSYFYQPSPRLRRRPRGLGAQVVLEEIRVISH
ncbi:hypothetical protein GGR54DRAFT_606387 [Hypoxylon sp. NC1633]|nr:hypothetical protein GGR54DRAFT_606387 [Hypoxylon sp. NC1633]